MFSLVNCSHKIWCICAHMMLCYHDMCFLNISGTSSTVACISHIEILPILSSSSPGKLPLLLQQT